MFRAGSKFLYALSAFGFVAAFFYALATGNHAVGMDSLVGPLTLGYKGRVGDHVGYSILVVLQAIDAAGWRTCACTIPAVSGAGGAIEAFALAHRR